MRPVICTSLAWLVITSTAFAEEFFVTLHKVKGQTISFSESGGGRSRGRGRLRAAPSTTVVVPADVKITSASRERRTGKFRVGVELSGGLKNLAFLHIGTGLQARIVTAGKSVKEINVILPQYDINQSTTDANGRAVIAVRPRRPPTKR